jgi:hypothetical protein
MAVARSKAVARAKNLAGAKRLQLVALGRCQYGIDARLALPKERIESRLHLSAKTTEVLRLLRHDRVDATLLVGREIELARESLAHLIGAARITAASTSPFRWRTEGWSEPASVTSPIVKRKPIGGETKAYPRERDNGEQRNRHRPRRAPACPSSC